jgi:hypothetical protein
VSARANVPEVIADDDELYRRISTHHVDWTDRVVNRTAYYRSNPLNRNKYEPDPEISVALARLTTPDEYLRHTNRPRAGIGLLVAGEVRRLGFSIRHAPDEQGGPAHCLIEGPNTRDLCEQLAERTRVIRWPGAPETGQSVE